MSTSENLMLRFSVAAKALYEQYMPYASVRLEDVPTPANLGFSDYQIAVMAIWMETASVLLRRSKGIEDIAIASVLMDGFDDTADSLFEYSCLAVRDNPQRYVFTSTVQTLIMRLQEAQKAHRELCEAPSMEIPPTYESFELHCPNEGANPESCSCDYHIALRVFNSESPVEEAESVDFDRLRAEHYTKSSPEGDI